VVWRQGSGIQTMVEQPDLAQELQDPICAEDGVFVLPLADTSATVSPQVDDQATEAGCTVGIGFRKGYG